MDAADLPEANAATDRGLVDKIAANVMRSLVMFTTRAILKPSSLVPYCHLFAENEIMKAIAYRIDQLRLSIAMSSLARSGRLRTMARRQQSRSGGSPEL